jgi:hypothetical protein
MTIRLRQYLELERLLLTLPGDSVEADHLRDAMDPIWYSLSDGERRVLDDRHVTPYVGLEAVSLRVGAEIFCEIPTVPERPLPDGPVPGWRSAA